jgi:aryl-alcohol dehydrogenase-like predicted oxidoreductase
MEFRTLGPSGLRVSALALGTMTWGEQNTEADAHAQLDCALDHGVNLVDTAEMYPVAPRPETQGHTERFIGTWLAASPARRDRIVLATKIAGPGRSFAWIRGGKTRFDAATLKGALEGSLRRLQTDHVDLYQLHWPERVTNFFGSVEYKHDPHDTPTPPDETLRGLQDLITSGKVGHIGLSNETPWGVMAFLAAAERAGLPRVVTVQNPYNLLNRSYETGLSEISHREGVGLLAYSPLAMGVLSGKYRGGSVEPPGARMTMFSRFKRYTGPEAFVASERYAALAREHGLDPAQMALAWINRQPFVTSNLLGATTLDQLRANLASAEVVLSDEFCAGIEAIHRAWPNPAP